MNLHLVALSRCAKPLIILCVCALKLNFLNFEILHTCEFVFLFVQVRVVYFVFVTMVNFGDCGRIVLAFFSLGNDVDEALSSWKMDFWL